MQRCKPSLRLGIGLRPVFQQGVGNVHLVLTSGDMQRSVTVFSCELTPLKMTNCFRNLGVTCTSSMGRCPFVQQEQSHILMVVMRGNVQRGDSIFTLSVDRRLPLQQQLGHFQVAIFGSQVKGGEAFFRGGVDRSAIVQENGGNLKLHYYNYLSS